MVAIACTATGAPRNGSLPRPSTCKDDGKQVYRYDGSRSRYDGRVYFERLSSIKTINRQLVSNLEKKHHDFVTFIYCNKTFSGIIDVTCIDELPESKLQDSPEKLDPSSNKPIYVLSFAE